MALSGTIKPKELIFTHASRDARIIQKKTVQLNIYETLKERGMEEVRRVVREADGLRIKSDENAGVKLKRVH